MEFKDIIKSKYNRFKELNTPINYILENSFESSSKSDLNIAKISEENLVNNLDTELKTIIKEDRNSLNNTILNKNQITNFNFFIIGKKEILNPSDINLIKYKSEEKNNKETKKRGRKRKREDTGNNEDDYSDIKTHDKFSDDNMRKKCKNIVLKYILEFINRKIKEKYLGKIGHGKFKKELKILKQEDKVNSTVDNDKLFLNKSIKAIFSEDISPRFSNYPPTHNKIIIESLINEKDEDKKIYFNSLFNITFLDCLKHFRGDIIIKELDGFIKFSSVEEKIKNKHGKSYVDLMIYYLKGFQEIINNKKPRKIHKKVEENNIKKK